jgi:cellulose synthase/poly-beta-1,6-N-acetylglucosamine synthase-like glycosyltransferase
MEMLVTIMYLICMLYIFLFSISQLYLTWVYVRPKRNPEIQEQTKSDFCPEITVQLPIYNEKYVVERLIDAVSKLDYPKTKLEIQILDDSTDETSQIILKKIESLRPLGLNIKFIHREDRRGYKAGALGRGLKLADGEFIAIFDADFLPEPDFLKNTIKHFSDPEVGVVQTRWTHLNSEYSLLTKLQAFALDAHFSIEQSARNSVGGFMNFNGTGGMWRKKCIESSGGWAFDTLTEDLDLSYRAQLKGWKFKYLQDITTPAELPVVMQAIKSQQFRWSKGAAETARKLFGEVMQSNVSPRKKILAFFHLFNSSVFVCVFIAALLSVPVLYIKGRQPDAAWVINLSVIFFIGFLSISLFYWIATKQFNRNPLSVFIKLFPGFLIVSMGLSLHNGIAVIEGLLGIKTPFVRTPKFDIRKQHDTWKGKVYLKPSINVVTILEGLLSLYFLFGMGAGIYLNDFTLIVFHTMLAVGFGAVFYFSLKSFTHA